MTKQQLLSIAALLICSLAPFVHSEPLLTGIFYDPDGVDTGFEWVELYNPTNESINLADYILYKGNGDKENDWTVLPTLSGTIYPLSFYLIGESNVSGADLILKLALFNGPDAVALRSLDNETVDLVGYGSLALGEYYLGNFALDVISDKALSRRFNFNNGTYSFSQTINNSQDWQSSIPNPRNSLFQYVAPLIQNTSVTLVVPTLPILIENVTLFDDQPSKYGVQWSIAGKKRIELTLLDESSSFNVSALQVKMLHDGIYRNLPIQVQSIENSTDSQNRLFVELITQLDSDLFAGNYSLTLEIGTDSDSMSTTRYVEILPSIGMIVCDSLVLERKNNAEYGGSCLIQNVGNVAAYYELNLTFDSNIVVKPYVGMNGTYESLTNASLLLDAGEQKYLEIVANISRLISFGSYSGTLQVRAWARN